MNHGLKFWLTAAMACAQMTIGPGPSTTFYIDIEQSGSGAMKQTNEANTTEIEGLYADVIVSKAGQPIAPDRMF